MRPAVLSFRTEAVGGDVLSAPDLTGLRSTLTHGKLLLLVHGYNNTFDAANESYNAFLGIQAALYGAASVDALPTDRDVVEVFWAGDGWGFLGPLYYPVALEHAMLTAPQFAASLQVLAVERGMPLEVDFVGHSLGCRLILETIRCLPAVGPVQVGRVALMAAAVPIQFLADGAHPRNLLTQFEQVSARGAMSLYSLCDQVLAGAFPLGETATANEQCWMPTALGHDYWQASHAGAGFEQHVVSGAGHSDYWGQHGNSAQTTAKVAGQFVRDFLHLPIGTRQLMDAHLPEVTLEMRDLDSRLLNERELAER